jgi:hypothetical protein
VLAWHSAAASSAAAVAAGCAYVSLQVRATHRPHIVTT